MIRLYTSAQGVAFSGMIAIPDSTGIAVMHRHFQNDTLFSLTSSTDEAAMELLGIYQSWARQLEAHLRKRAEEAIAAATASVPGPPASTPPVPEHPLLGRETRIPWIDEGTGKLMWDPEVRP